MQIAIPLQPTEQELIHACIDRQAWAQQKIYEDNYRNMMAVCLRYSNSSDDAFDILHEGFLKVFMNIKSYEPGSLLQAWIRRVMVNTAIDFYRKESRRTTSDLDDARTLVYSKGNPIDSMAAEEIMKAIQKLPPIYRSVFNMFAIEGYSHKEIADTLGITESTSRSNLVKARTKLKELLHGKI
ncbi:MAG: RNA polymerase sigma factor [Saprospiraceae bacterium]|nr:RNA polymerase sigma factor [Saprospiraceae bacterium]MBK8451678.1 RNA polymerase sigma factor [Saprospiraceae bacterium]MBK8486126.1 RNA polymerase sigma factor [Saprospiraceae bacterium]MBK9221144.1 RNA polymerase sigma factor [Saprospiraceae bacterium]MBK9721931.1 RNA polymerase sigma factor [Saprospiraceae bacterium]